MIKITQNFYQANVKTVVHKWLTTLCLTVVLCMVTGNVMGQGSFTGTWALTANQNAAVTGGASSTAVATGQVYGSGFYISASNPYYGVTTSTAGDGLRSSPKGGGTDGTWSTYGTVTIENQYMEFAIEPASGYNASVSAISFYLGNRGTSNIKASVYYYVATSNSGLTKSNGTALGTALSCGSSSGWAAQNNYTPTISIPAGNKLFVRVYPYMTSSASTSKWFCMKNVVITGATTSACTTPDLTYNLTGSTSICNGESATLGLDDSQTDVSYQLYNESTPVGGLVPGTGAAISFAAVSPTSTTTYSVKATGTGGAYCTTETAAFTSTATVSMKSVSAAPVVSSPIFEAATSVSGICAEADGTSIDVFVNNVSVGTTTVTGGNWSTTVAALTLGDVVTAQANAAGKCLSAVSNSVIVSVFCVTPPTPAIPSGTYTSCTSITLPTPNAGDYWQTTANGTNTSALPAVTVTATYYLRSQSGTCWSTAASQVVTINTTSVSGGAATVNVGATTPAFTGLPAGGTWSATNGTIDASGVFTATNSGTAVITYTAISGCTATANVTVTLSEFCKQANTNTNTTSYDFGNATLLWSSTGGTTYTSFNRAGSASNLCNGATHRYYTSNVVVSLDKTGASKITLQGQQGYNVSIASVAVADNINGPYTLLTAGTDYTAINYTGPINTCGTLGISGIDIDKGKYVLISFVGGTLNEFRISGVCITPIDFPVTWNGTAWSSGVAPIATQKAIIDGNYDTYYNGGGFTAKTLTVNSGNILYVYYGANVIVQNEIINNAGPTGLIVEIGANLIQVNPVANTGAITVNTSSNQLKRLDYTMWSSPVTGTQRLYDFSPLTSTNRFYVYNPGTNVYDTVLNGAYFTLGKGYLIRMPNENPSELGTSTPYYLGNQAIYYNSKFIGTPNNGTVNITGLTANKFNAIGNPYPSTVDADLFIGMGNTTGTLYFFRKTNGVANSNSSYATYTTAGGVAANEDSINDPDGEDPSGNNQKPNGTIQVGQGFIVEPTGTTVSFNNTMRVADNRNQFFKTKKVVEKNRVWLNLTNATGAFSQTLVAYMTGATQDVDAGIDGKSINDAKVALTSNIDNVDYTIQGRSLPFNPADVVPLNFKTDVAGDYTIAIDHADGLFAAGQDVYLVDSVTGTETDLKAGGYTFTAPVGAANARFSLKYQKTLGVDAPAFNENSVTVYKNKGVLSVNSGNITIANVKVYDVQGKLLAELKDVKSTSATISNLKSTQQVLVVKVTAQDGTVVTKKVIN